MTRSILVLALGLGACTTATVEPVAPVATTGMPVPPDPVAPPAPKPANPLLADWSGPYGGIPAWDKYSPAQFGEAFTYAIEDQRREIAAIADNPAPATFDPVLKADRAYQIAAASFYGGKYDDVNNLRHSPGDSRG